MATIYPFRTSRFASNIYLYGTTKFSEIPEEYIEPVKQHAAATFSDETIDNALAQGWINEQEYLDTMAYKYPNSTETTTQ